MIDKKYSDQCLVPDNDPTLLDNITIEGGSEATAEEVCAICNRMVELLKRHGHQAVKAVATDAGIGFVKA